MGRQQYLSRLALGRSAFAGIEDDQPAAEGDQHKQADANDPSSDSQYVQQYNSKGRSINPATEERNAALRNAENTALALVGVVERNDAHDRVNELKFRAIGSVREEVLAAENDAGETLDLIVTLISFCNYATETLVRRVQAGLYRPSDSFASILHSGHEDIRHAGLGGSFAILFPGAPAALVHAIARVLLGATLSTGVEYLSQWLIRQKLRKRTARRAHRALYFACETLLISLDLALLPLEYYAFVQRLGLAPTWPLLPSWRILLPSNPTSIHHFGWQSQLAIPVLRRLCSPAALVLLQSSLWREQDAEIPVASQFTRFEYPEQFNAPSWTISPPKAAQDPFGWVFYQGYVLRTRFMRFFGYNLEHHGLRTKFENDRLPRTPQPEALDEIPDDLSSSDGEDGESDGMQHIHRSTELAHLAPKYLAHRIDVAYAKLLLLPLQALVVRSVTQSYLTSPFPKTPFALAAAPCIYAPFGGNNPLALLRQPGGLSELGAYLSQLGLSLSLHAAASTGLFFMVYKLARRQGRRNFDWGGRGKIGGLVYPTEGEE